MSAERISTHVDDPVAVLRGALDAAMRAVLHLDPRDADARAGVDRALVAFDQAVAPVRDRLSALAQASPQGPVSVTLGFVHDAARHTDVQAARVALLAGRATAFRLVRDHR